MLIWVITITLFLLGLLGVFVPGLPGVGLVFAGVLLYAAATGFASLSLTTVVVLGLISLAAWLLEYLGALIGTKVGGGGRWALLGTLVGAVLGIIAGGPLGLLVGLLLGSMLGSLYEGRTPEAAGRAALFTVVGMAGAKALQLILAGLVIVVFVIAVVF